MPHLVRFDSKPSLPPPFCGTGNARNLQNGEILRNLSQSSIMSQIVCMYMVGAAILVCTAIADRSMGISSPQWICQRTHMSIGVPGAKVISVSLRFRLRVAAIVLEYLWCSTQRLHQRRYIRVAFLRKIRQSTSENIMCTLVLGDKRKRDSKVWAGMGGRYLSTV